jgi:lysophospholipase L1-like esterase
LTPTLFKISIALAASGLSAGSWAGADITLLHVQGLHPPVELHCPASRAQARPPTSRVAPSLEGTAAYAPMPVIQEPAPAQEDPALPPPPKVGMEVGIKVGLWGDSHTASGTFADTLMETLLGPRPLTRPSFIAPTFGLKGVRAPLRRACLSDDWQLSLAYRTPSESTQAYTKSLAHIRTETAGGFMWLDFRHPDAHTRVKWADIHIAPNTAARPVVLGVSVDDGAEATVQLDTRHGQRLRVQSEQAFATLRLRIVAGPIRIDGIAPVYEGPTQTLLDMFSIPGATAKGWRVVDTAHLRREDPLESGYDVVILQSGTNESLDPDFKVGLYEAQLNSSLARLKAAYPRARCILIGPPDAQRSSQTLRLINNSQQRLAAAQGCRHWNWQQAMGGPGASVQWLGKGLMQADLLHLTPAGYEQSARHLVRQVPIQVR